MARRIQSSLKSTFSQALYVLIIFGAFLVLTLTSYLLSSKIDPFRSYSQFPNQDFLENPSTLRGNTYKLDAEVENVLANSPKRGRLLSVRSKNGTPLPLLLPSKFQSLNIQKGQNFVFLVTINQENFPEVVELKK
ncbi:MAG: hypothetical protein N2035_06450 [Chthoniobacterales bacterium]|nr:hypothetical protein [Chthoniobacterales bacterium]MCX7713287.1 hypothetical protein [Chthoniobacterales bacterium]